MCLGAEDVFHVFPSLVKNRSSDEMLYRVCHVALAQCLVSLWIPFESAMFSE
jgi:hypothetical protein